MIRELAKIGAVVFISEYIRNEKMRNNFNKGCNDMYKQVIEPIVKPQAKKVWENLTKDNIPEAEFVEIEAVNETASKSGE